MFRRTARLIAVLGMFLTQLPSTHADPDPAALGMAAQADSPGFYTAAVHAAYETGSLDAAVALLLELAPLPKNPAVSGALYAELAGLLALGARWPEASDAWVSAADAGYRPGPSMLEGAACMLAAGDASEALKLILGARERGLDGQETLRSRVLEGWAARLNGDAARGLALAKEALGTASGDIKYLALYLALSCAEGGERDQYSRQATAMWPGFDLDGPLQGAWSALTSLADVPAVWVEGSDQSVPQQQSALASSPATKPSGPDADAPLWYQLGAFRDMDKAVELGNALAAAGFRASMARKNGGTDWLYIVFVDAGDDPAATLLSLKDAGFEAWPLYGQAASQTE